jgi:shikimate dehydrogenase
VIPGAGASTRLIALLGDPVDHSLSPSFQNAALRAAGLDGVYLALRCDAEALPGLLRGIARAGGAGNVTVPHKQRAATIVDVRTPAVQRTGACNTFWQQDGRVHGDNTDVEGFRAAVRELLGRDAAGAGVLLLGAGGAARAALHALELDGAASVTILNRTHAAAADLAGEFGGGELRVDAAERQPNPPDRRFDLVVNATSLGLRDGDAHPLRLEEFPAGAAALDLVYRRGGTAWISELRGRGHPAADGTTMLLAQGAAAFACWWNRAPPLEAMRAALTEQP